MNNEEVNLQAVVEGQETASGIDAGKQLLGLAEAMVHRDIAAIEASRSAVAASLGEDAMVDSVCVVANFQRMVRIADSTGIPLDAPVLLMTQGIREDLHIDDYHAASNSPPLNLGKRILGRLLAPFAPQMLRRISQKRNA